MKIINFVDSTIQIFLLALEELVVTLCTNKFNNYNLRVLTTQFIHGFYEVWNFNSGNYLFTTDTK